MNDKPDSIERQSRDTRPQPAWREPRRARPPFRDTRPQPAWRGAHPATACKAALLAVLMAGLCPGRLRADGFFDPPPPSAERVAALDALCERLEALGMPAVPPDAQWTFLHTGGSWVGDDDRSDRPSLASRVPYFGEPPELDMDGNAWLWKPSPSEPARILLVFGDLFVAGPDGKEEHFLDSPSARLRRATTGLHAALALPGGPPPDAILGPAVLFCAQLHRHGDSARAAALLALLEERGRLGEATAGAEAAIGCAKFARIRSSFSGPDRLREDRLREFADALAENLARFPGAFSNAVPGGFPDPRPALLDGARGRLDGADGPVPGVPDDLQGLARALDRASEHDGDRAALGPAGEKLAAGAFLDIPWLFPEAWTNALSVPSNAVWRIRALGPRALDLLLPLLDDPTFVEGDWRDRGRVGSKICNSRADAAAVLLYDLLPHRSARFLPDEEREAFFRDRVRDADDEDRLLLYLSQNADHSPWHTLAGRDGLLLAWFAERAAAGPLRKVEDRLESIVRDIPIRDSIYGEPAAPRALLLAGFYAAVRGEAAAPFRDRILAALRGHAASWDPPAAAVAERDILGRPCPGRFIRERYQDPDLARRRARDWYARQADALAAVPLGPSDPAALRARAGEIAGWLRAVVRGDDPPPAPAPLRALAAPFEKPTDLWTSAEWEQKKEQRPAPDRLFLPKLGRVDISYPAAPVDPEKEEPVDWDGVIDLDW